MWRVIFVLLALGLLAGCDSLEEAVHERDTAIPLPFGGRMHRMCVDGYEFLASDMYHGTNLVQFWELGANGQPRPRVCGGDYAE